MGFFFWLEAGLAHNGRGQDRQFWPNLTCMISNRSRHSPSIGDSAPPREAKRPAVPAHSVPSWWPGGPYRAPLPHRQEWLGEVEAALVHASQPLRLAALELVTASARTVAPPRAPVAAPVSGVRRGGGVAPKRLAAWMRYWSGGRCVRRRGPHSREVQPASLLFPACNTPR